MRKVICSREVDAVGRYLARAFDEQGKFVLFDFGWMKKCPKNDTYK